MRKHHPIIRGHAGFTLIEVMFSLIIFMVALMGLISLQKVSIEGAERGRQHTVAVNLASYFLTQLQNEVSCWGSAISHSSFPADKFPMLASSIGQNETLSDVWYELNPDESLRVDDFLGHSKLTGGESSLFCVNYRISCIETPRDTDGMTIQCANNVDSVNVWKVRVRVSWSQRGQFGNQDGEDDIPWTSCAPGDVTYRVDQSHTDRAVELVGVATREFSL